MFTVYSIFDSLDGEISGFHQGAITTFIRFSECNIFCKFCDTTYALKKDSGKNMTLDELISELFTTRPKLKKVTITGGEPLLQPDLPDLLDVLITAGINTSIETNGTIEPIEKYLGHPQVNWVYDFKLENSGERNRMDLNSFCKLEDTDIVKFVVSNETDVEEAILVGKVLRNNGCKAKFAFSPTHEQLKPDDLLKFLQKLGNGDEIINLQLHKYIWGAGTAIEEH